MKYPHFPLTCSQITNVHSILHHNDTAQSTFSLHYIKQADSPVYCRFLLLVMCVFSSVFLFVPCMFNTFDVSVTKIFLSFH